MKSPAVFWWMQFMNHIMNDMENYSEMLLQGFSVMSLQSEKFQLLSRDKAMFGFTCNKLTE